MTDYITLSVLLDVLPIPLLSKYSTTTLRYGFLPLSSTYKSKVQAWTSLYIIYLAITKDEPVLLSLR